MTFSPERLSSEELELLLKTNFMEALKDSGLRSFSFSKEVQILKTEAKEEGEERVSSILLFRSIQPKKLAEIDFVATHKDFKRQGLARALVTDLASEYEEVWLELLSSNASAVAFYQNMGFKLQGERKNYYGEGLNALNMVKRTLKER